MSKIVSLDSTILNTLQQCDTKYFLNFEQQVQPMHKAEPLEEGSLMHNMLEVYYAIIGKVVVPDSPSWLELKEAGLFNGDPESLYKLTWPEIVRHAIEVGRWYFTKTELDPAEAEMIIYQFSEYCEHYRYEPWVPLAVEEVGARELFFDDDLQIIYNFKIDLVAQQNGRLMPWDHKTSKKRSTPTSLSNQFIGYCFGLQVNHILINKIGFQKTLSRSDRFQRFTLTIDDDRIKEWQLNSAYWTIFHLAMAEDNYELYIPKLKLLKKELNGHTKNLTSCDKYSGCIYSDICEASPLSRQNKIERDYKIGQKWDVASILEASPINKEEN